MFEKWNERATEDGIREPTQSDLTCLDTGNILAVYGLITKGPAQNRILLHYSPWRHGVHRYSAPI